MVIRSGGLVLTGIGRIPPLDMITKLLLPPSCRKRRLPERSCRKSTKLRTGIFETEGEISAVQVTSLVLIYSV
jgi:hypothetical protein